LLLEVVELVEECRKTMQKSWRKILVVPPLTRWWRGERGKGGSGKFFSSILCIDFLQFNQEDD